VTQSDLTVALLANDIGMGLSYGVYKVNDGTNNRLVNLDYENNILWILAITDCSTVAINKLGGLDSSNGINELAYDGTSIYLTQWETDVDASKFSYTDIFGNGGAWVETSWDGGSYETDDPFYADITGLTPSTKYEFQGRNQNDDGEGDWSASNTFTTGGNTTVSTTSNLKLQATSGTDWTGETSSAISLDVTVDRKAAYKRVTSSALSLLTSILAKAKAAYNFAVSCGLALGAAVNRKVTTTRATSSGITLAASVVIAKTLLIITSCALALSASVSRTATFTRSTASNLGLAVNLIKHYGRTFVISTALSLSARVWAYARTAWTRTILAIDGRVVQPITGRTIQSLDGRTIQSLIGRVIRSITGRDLGG